MDNKCAALLGDLTNRSFNWTFVSPPANYCPSVGTGKYVAVPNDYLPVDQNGDYRGIATSDLAIALADEAESQTHPFLHWTLYGDQPDLVSRVPIYLTLKDVKNKRLKHPGPLE
jgi:putative NADH-flavin reductase